MPDSLDEYPIHQAPVSMGTVATSDRNFYDRAYFNAHDRTGDVFLVTGMGVYANLGVTDAFALVRRGDRQWSVRCSDAMSDDRLAPSVGPYRVEVIEPLRRIRLVCDADETDGAPIGFDLTWEGSFPAIDEPHHVMRSSTRVILDGQRFAQVGTWEGQLRVDGETTEVSPDVWVGTRDRSWGIRPVGEAEPSGRGEDEPLEGFWWLYVPLRFDDFGIITIIQESPDGHRTLSESSRIWPDGRIEQLGWPEVDISYRPGTRHPDSAVLHLGTRKDAFEVAIETLLPVPIHVGGGYGGDPDWSHGVWRGRKWVESASYDMNDPEIAGRVPFGVIDHVGKASIDGAEGYGLFEHGSMGRHDPTGFVDWSDVAD